MRLKALIYEENEVVSLRECMFLCILSDSYWVFREFNNLLVYSWIFFQALLVMMLKNGYLIWFFLWFYVVGGLIVFILCSMVFMKSGRRGYMYGKGV